MIQMPVPFSDASLSPPLFFPPLQAIPTLFSSFFSPTLLVAPYQSADQPLEQAATQARQTLPLGGERIGTGKVRNIETSN